MLFSTVGLVQTRLLTSGVKSGPLCCIFWPKLNAEFSLLLSECGI